ncbi:MAG: DNA recombination protein RmuC [Acidobacteriota bacterium]
MGTTELMIILSGLLIIIILLIFKIAGSRTSGISSEQILKDYVPREIYTKLESELKDKERLLYEKGEIIISLNNDLTKISESFRNIKERLENEKKEMGELQLKFKDEFENLANRLLDEKSRKFTEINEENLSKIIYPFRDKLSDLKKDIENIHKEESREVISLKTEIKSLMELNRQVSRDADNLAKALKGDSKLQGDWGEISLERVLEKAGLEENVHYTKQDVFTDDDKRRKRPDFIIHLPEEKHVIIDSKVSLTAYEKYFNTEKNGEKEIYLKDHIKSITDHISGLSKKNYQNLYGINSPDYILMYMPIESALVLALRHDQKIVEDALERNIVFVTTSTLLATLKTVSYLWKHEKQKKYVSEIARQGGALYDKFANFVTDLENIGEKLDTARASYDSAMNKLISGGKKGDTILGRIENLKKLGARTSKEISKKLEKGD